MLIQVKDLQIKGESFVSLVRQQMKDHKLNRQQAYYRVVEHLEILGYGYPYTSFESFCRVYYSKK